MRFSVSVAVRGICAVVLLATAAGALCLAHLFLASESSLRSRFLLENRNGSLSSEGAAAAAGEGRIFALKELRRAGVDLGAKTSTGITPMIAAIRGGSLDSIAYLLPLFEVERTLHVASADTHVTAFEEAIHSGDFVLAEKIHRIVEELNSGSHAGVEEILSGTTAIPRDSYAHLRSLDIDPILAITQPNENMPMIVAVARNDGARIKKLIRESKDIDFTLPNGESLLVTAIRSENHDLVMSLLNAGAKINERESRRRDIAPERRSPLEAAVELGDYTLVDLLLHKGADPNARQSDGLFAMESAVLNGDCLLADLLVKGGAKVDDPDLVRAVLEIQNVPLLRVLLEGGASASGSFSDGVSFLQRMIEAEAFHCVKALLEYEAEPEGTLVTALQAGNWDVLELLLSFGLSVDDMGGERGVIPMDFAVSTRDARLMKILSDHGANPIPSLLEERGEKDLSMGLPKAQQNEPLNESVLW